MNLKVKNIVKDYKDFKLKNISFVIPDCSITSIIGNNGAGKTTLMKILSTLSIPNSGEIVFNDVCYNYKKFNKIRGRISVLFDSTGSLYMGLTVLQNIKYFLEISDNNYDEKEVLKYLELFSLSSSKNKVVSKISKGMKQKVALIIALLKKSELLILDEPYLGLDYESVCLINKILIKQAKEKIIIISAQSLNPIDNPADYILKLNDGRLEYFKDKDGVK